jgi:hypothetical protein
MRDLRNQQELEQLINLYKDSKITQYALESELTKSMTEFLYPMKVIVSIVKQDAGHSGSTFGVKSLPEVNSKDNTMLIAIDNSALLNLFSTEDLIKIFKEEAYYSQHVLKEYSRFLISKLGSDASLSESLIFFMRLYRDSLKNLSEKLPLVITKLQENKSLVTIEQLEAEMADIAQGKEKIELAIEKLVVKGLLPLISVEKARQLTQVIANSAREDESLKLFTNPHEPAMNQFRQKQRALSDGTYSNKPKSTIIPFDYEPETNQ